MADQHTLTLYRWNEHKPEHQSWILYYHKRFRQWLTGQFLEDDEYGNVVTTTNGYTQWESEVVEWAYTPD